MQLRRFNAAGLERFRDYIKLLIAGKRESNFAQVSLPAPMELLTDDSLTELIAPATECLDAVFANRLAAAEYLDRLLTPLGCVNLFEDKELWSWLALRFFEQLRPLKDGVVIYKGMGVDESRFIPSSDWSDQHRHLLRHPLQVYVNAGRNADDAMCFLAQPVYKPGDIIEQLQSRQMYWHHQRLFSATFSALVVDKNTKQIRPNAPTKARRLDSLIGQFDCTWDIEFFQKDSLLNLLPDEFKELKGKRRAKSSASK